MGYKNPRFLKGTQNSLRAVDWAKDVNRRQLWTEPRVNRGPKRRCLFTFAQARAFVLIQVLYSKSIATNDIKAIVKSRQGCSEVKGTYIQVVWYNINTDNILFFKSLSREKANWFHSFSNFELTSSKCWNEFKCLWVLQIKNLAVLWNGCFFYFSSTFQCCMWSNISLHCTSTYKYLTNYSRIGISLAAGCYQDAHRITS